YCLCLYTFLSCSSLSIFSFSFYLDVDHRYLHSFPTRRSSDLFVFCPRYRRKIFLNERIDNRFKALVSEVAMKHDFKIVALETDKDYCHIFLNALPTYSPSDIMSIIT